MEEFIKLVISFMGGGVIAGLISWARIARSERESRKAEYIKQQMNNLYGPVYYFSSQNVKLFELSNSLMSAYGAEYVDQEWSPDSTTQKNLGEDATKTIDISNTYVKTATENNMRIIEILQSNAEFIDPEDNVIFQQFVIDNLRLKVEREESGKLITPLMIYKRVGGIPFMRSEFTELVKKKFVGKCDELKKFH